MPAYGKSLSSEELAQITAVLQSRRVTAHQTRQLPQTGKVQRIRHRQLMIPSRSITSEELIL
jgi:hypothetical protein